MKRESVDLIGKWQFIAAESYCDSQWISSENFVKKMVWEFHPQYLGTKKTIGNIVETTQYNTTPIEMAYSYDKAINVLKVEIFTDCTIGQDDKSESDLYEITVVSNTPPTIKITIQHLRYTLKKIE